jgi:hypothetical protein
VRRVENVNIPEETGEKMWINPQNPENYQRRIVMMQKCGKGLSEGGDNSSKSDIIIIIIIIIIVNHDEGRSV